MKKSDQIFIVTANLIMWGVLVLHAYLGTFSRFIADDFCSALQVKRLGIFRATWFWYLNWSGRFSATASDALVDSFGPGFTPFVTSLVLILWLLGLYIVIRTYFSGLDRFTTLLLATALLYGTLTISPNIYQSLYWGQGMRAVVPPLILSTYFLTFFYATKQSSKNKIMPFLWASIGFGFGVFTGGFNETFAIIEVILLSCLAIFSFFKTDTLSKNQKYVLATGILGSITALIIMLLAPGNAKRQAFYPPPPGLMEIINISLKGFLIFIGQIQNSTEKISALIAISGIASFIGRNVEKPKTPLYNSLLVFMGGLGCALACFAPAAYAISDVAPDRTQIIPAYFMVNGIVMASFLAGQHIQSTKSIILHIGQILAIGFLILSTSTNSLNLYSQKDEFIRYAQWWDQTDEMIIQSREQGKENITIPFMQSWAQLDVLGDNPKFWLNTCMSGYYDIKLLGKPIQ